MAKLDWISLPINFMASQCCRGTTFSTGSRSTTSGQKDTSQVGYLVIWWFIWWFDDLFGDLMIYLFGDLMIYLVIWGLDDLVTWWLVYLVTCSLGDLVTWLLGDLVTWLGFELCYPLILRNHFKWVYLLQPVVFLGVWSKQTRLVVGGFGEG